MGREGKQTTLPVDSPPPPLPRRRHRRNPLNWRLHLNWTNSLTHEFIKYRNSLPSEIAKHTPENTPLASNWTENKARVPRASTGNSNLFPVDACTVVVMSCLVNVSSDVMSYASQSRHAIYRGSRGIGLEKNLRCSLVFEQNLQF